MKKPHPKATRFQERKASKPVTVAIHETRQLEIGSINDTNRILNDVVVLTRQSENVDDASGNRRVYTDEALRQAAGLFENSKVYVNHRDLVETPDGTVAKPHPVENYVGRINGLYLDKDGKLRAREFRVMNMSHWNLVEIARSDPAAFGFSIDAEGQVDPEGRVVRILRANSADLVSDPATTQGLFEQNKGKRMNAITEAAAAEGVQKIKDMVSEFGKSLTSALEGVFGAPKGEPDGDESQNDDQEGKSANRRNAKEGESNPADNTQQAANAPAGTASATPPPAAGAASATDVQQVQRESRVLRKLMASGVQLSEVQIKAACALSEKDLDIYLKEVQESQGSAGTPKLREGRKASAAGSGGSNAKLTVDHFFS